MPWCFSTRASVLTVQTEYALMLSKLFMGWPDAYRCWLINNCGTIPTYKILVTIDYQDGCTLATVRTISRDWYWPSCVTQLSRFVVTEVTWVGDYLRGCVDLYVTLTYPLKQDDKVHDSPKPESRHDANFVVWNLRVDMVPTLLSFMGPDVVIVMTSGAASDDKVGIVTVHMFSSWFCSTASYAKILLKSKSIFHGYFHFSWLIEIHWYWDKVVKVF